MPAAVFCIAWVIWFAFSSSLSAFFLRAAACANNSGMRGTLSCISSRPSVFTPAPPPLPPPPAPEPTPPASAWPLASEAAVFADGPRVRETPSF